MHMQMYFLRDYIPVKTTNNLHHCHKKIEYHKNNSARTITNRFGTSSVKPWDNGRADTYSSKWVRHSNWIH